jgi:hypothetical protein
MSLESDGPDPSRVATDAGEPAAKDTAETTETVPWWRRTRNQVLGGVGAVVTGVLIAVIANMVSARLPAPQPGQPTSTAVTPGTNEPQSSTRGTGWSAVPIVLENDYVSVTAFMQPYQSCKAATGWVFKQPMNKLAPLAPTSLNGINTWAVRNGGIPQSGNYITLTVQGRNGHTVVIESLGVKILRRAAPPTGTAAMLGGGCGGLRPSFFDVNLDKPGLQATPVSGVNPLGNKVPAVPLPHTVTESGPEQWRLRITTTNCDCTFVPYFTWSSDGNVGTFNILDGSKPWRVAAVTRAHPAFMGINGRWTPS